MVSPFCVKTAIPVALLPLAEPMVAIACFDGFEEIPIFCMTAQLANEIETLTNNSSNEAFTPKSTKRFFMVKSSIIKVEVHTKRKCKTVKETALLPLLIREDLVTGAGD